MNTNTHRHTHIHQPSSALLCVTIIPYLPFAMNNPRSFIFSPKELGVNFMFCDLFRTNADFDFRVCESLSCSIRRHTTITLFDCIAPCSLKSQQLSEINYNKYINAFTYTAYCWWCFTLLENWTGDWRNTIIYNNNSGRLWSCHTDMFYIKTTSNTLFWIWTTKRYDTCSRRNPICGWAKMLFFFFFFALLSSISISNEFGSMCWCDVSTFVCACRPKNKFAHERPASTECTHTHTRA